MNQPSSDQRCFNLLEFECLILSFLISYRMWNIPAIEITITTMPIICATNSRDNFSFFYYFFFLFSCSLCLFHSHFLCAVFVFSSSSICICSVWYIVVVTLLLVIECRCFFFFFWFEYVASSFILSFNFAFRLRFHFSSLLLQMSGVLLFFRWVVHFFFIERIRVQRKWRRYVSIFLQTEDWFSVNEWRLNLQFVHKYTNTYILCLFLPFGHWNETLKTE